MGDDIESSMQIVRGFVGDNVSRSIFADALLDLLSEIEVLREALLLAAAEVYGSCDPLTTSPDDLARHFYEEARRG